MANIKVGDKIKKNQLIAIQDTSEFEYNLKIKQNQLTDAQLILEDLKNELNEEKSIKEIIQKQLNLLKVNTIELKNCMKAMQFQLKSLRPLRHPI